MPSVELVGPSGDEKTVTERSAFIQLVYAAGYRPKLGTIQQNWEYLSGSGIQPDPVPHYPVNPGTPASPTGEPRPVTLVGPEGDEVTITDRLAFVQLVYAAGYRPKIGTIQANWEALAGGPAPEPLTEYDLIRLGDLDDPNSEVVKRLKTLALEAASPEELEATVARYIAANSASVLAPHINSPTPHPVYDDMPDLTLLFENGLI